VNECTSLIPGRLNNFVRRRVLVDGDFTNTYGDPAEWAPQIDLGLAAAAADAVRAEDVEEDDDEAPVKLV